MKKEVEPSEFAKDENWIKMAETQKPAMSRCNPKNLLK